MDDIYNDVPVPGEGKVVYIQNENNNSENLYNTDIENPDCSIDSNARFHEDCKNIDEDKYQGNQLLPFVIICCLLVILIIILIAIQLRKYFMVR